MWLMNIKKAKKKYKTQLCTKHFFEKHKIKLKIKRAIKLSMSKGETYVIFTTDTEMKWLMLKELSEEIIKLGYDCILYESEKNMLVGGWAK